MATASAVSAVPAAAGYVDTRVRDCAGEGPGCRPGWSKGLELKGVATSPTVSMILGEEGGRAECVILVNGREAHRATADGAFGTATCTAPSPTRDAV
ncbi:hypothetical protein [Streptomyces sp. ZL-24]|uniref:hypothetical protein n=1 Tax=Streptomyces sp. ZL-24 TaxID=1933029 RepID=UPI0015E1825D|nr:hypothetical protein [Streptomyces sp. ZL-24]